MTRKPNIPHSLKLKHRYAKTASAFLERLPITQRFTESQRFLLKLTPTWQKWCVGASKQHNQRLDNCQLTAFEKGVLSISVNNASTATLIKHQLESVLTALHKKGFTDVQKIRVQLKIQHKVEPHNSTPTSAVYQEKPDQAAISALQSAAKNTDNSELSESLERLAHTLKQRRKEP